MKKKWIWGVILVVVLLIFLFLRGDEDTWVMNEKGEFVPHGVPAEMPEYVSKQKEVLTCAFDLYNQAEYDGFKFSSQCLGICQDYAVDIVNVPRTEEDNLPKNQCADYLEKKVNNFVELDKDGVLVRIG